MVKPPKKDWIELFDKKVENLEGRISNLEEHVTLMSELTIDTITIGLSLSLLAQTRPMKLENLDVLMNLLRRVLASLKKMKRSVYAVSPEVVVDYAIFLAKINEIPFQKLMPYLIEKLGKRTVKRIVKKETILQHYGKEGFTIWELLLAKNS